MIISVTQHNKKKNLYITKILTHTGCDGKVVTNLSLKFQKGQKTLFFWVLKSLYISIEWMLKTFCYCLSASPNYEVLEVKGSCHSHLWLPLQIARNAWFIEMFHRYILEWTELNEVGPMTVHGVIWAKLGILFLRTQFLFGQ